MNERHGFQVVVDVVVVVVKERLRDFKVKRL